MLPDELEKRLDGIEDASKKGIQYVIYTKLRVSRTVAASLREYTGQCRCTDSRCINRYH